MFDSNSLSACCRNPETGFVVKAQNIFAPDLFY